jgi:toxin-antitoxin system PIN domain toxin
MLCVDVNVLLYAFRQDLAEHEVYAPLLERLANGDESLGIPDLVLSGFLRIVTNRRVFVEPTAPADAWSFVDDLGRAPAATVLQAGDRHWQHFRRLATGIQAVGNDVADAYLAAYAAERNATWLSADRGFARFPDLRWRHPTSLIT